jgi:hypothetical protein
MDFQTIVFLTTAGTLILVIMVLAGLVLSARSFTQLAELIRYIGSLVAQQHQETRQAVTTLLHEVENGTSSGDQAATRTTPESPAGRSTEKPT